MSLQSLCFFVLGTCCLVQAPLNSAHAQQPLTIATCSTSYDIPGSLKFENNTGQSIDLYWVNYQCQEVLYSTLPPNTSVLQPSYVSHPWRLREHATGRLLKQVTLTSAATRFVPVNDACSGQLSDPAQLDFNNDLPFNVEVYWKDSSCQERFWFTLAPGSRYLQSTFANHAWRVRQAGSQTIIKDLVVDASGLTTVNIGERSVWDRVDDSSYYQVKPLYVLPSDGLDQQLDRNGTLVTSIAAAQQWLAQQSGDQRLRFDTLRGALDIGFVRLNKSDAQLNQQAVQQYGSPLFLREVLQDELHSAGWNDPGTVYLAYYGGTNSAACGGASLPPDGARGNVVALYLRGPNCIFNVFAPNERAPAYWEFSSIHEIFHSLGFAPTPGATGIPVSCAPHHTMAGHVSEDPRDLMYAGSLPWTPSILDIGRDDYFAHGRPDCPDAARSVFMNPAQSGAVPPLGWQ